MTVVVKSLKVSSAVTGNEVVIVSVMVETDCSAELSGLAVTVTVTVTGAHVSPVTASVVTEPSGCVTVTT